ncbi:MAG: Short-chain dehydrogenase [Mucilaginibacter sp.]|nr:Short-chain dehydrogenase [Mucilaginibacter sp.]
MKTVLITGANKGIGFETAKQLAQLGYFVYLGSREKTKGLDAITQLKESGISNIAWIEIDVTNIHSIKRAKQELETKIEALDILINNAGIAGDQPQNLATGDLENLRRIFDTNFFGTIQTTQEFLPLLRKAGQSAIINVSSEIGSLAAHTAAQRNPNRAKYHAYGASKTALNAFTVMLANELRDAGISVNSVTPGYTATDLNQFQGAKTAEEGAKAIVKYAIAEHDGTTGKFYNHEGEIAW